VIRMNDFKAEPAEMQDAISKAIHRVLSSGWYVLGEEGIAFERQWAKICGVQYGVGVGNGMDAIEIALRCLGVGAGDEVITTPMTAFASVLAILRAGATPVLADIDSESALMSLESAKRCVTPRTKAVLLVHLYGQMRCMSEWRKFCREKDLSLIEDCAQSHLARWGGSIAGSIGSVGAYSFYPTKNLGASGDAGMLITDNAPIAEKATRLRNYGQSERYHHPELGLNSRLDELQAAILSERLKWLYEFTERRRAIASAYRTGITNPLIKLLTAPEEPLAHVYHLFVITSLHRASVQAHLSANDIETLIHYPVPVHYQESCSQLARDPQGLRASETHAGQCLSLPCHPQMADADVAKVIAALNAFEAD